MRLFSCLLWSGLALGLCVRSGWAVDAVEQVTVRDDNGDGSFFSVNFEDNYLPNVVLRENGAASFEALKAQAVAARSFAYYKLSQGTSFLRNSQADQVYSRGGIQPNPGGLWDQAVRATEGEVLSFNNILTATFYVAGARPSDPSGVATGADSDPTNTERFVTYPYVNGQLGPNNRGSSLGFVGTVSNPNYPNRGAMSQNGADYLSDNGAFYYDILKFYYGGDSQLELVNQSSGQTPFETKSLTTFESGNQNFVRSLTFAGQTSNLGSGTAVARSQDFAQEGNFSQKLTFDYDAAADAIDGSINGFQSRHLSSVASAARLSNLTSGSALTPVADPVGNIILPTNGSIGVWLLVENQFAGAELTVSVAIDEFNANQLDSDLEQSLALGIVADGQWHKYEWSLEDNSLWSPAFGSPTLGDGVLGQRFTLDSFVFRGLADSQVYMDNVFYSSVSAVPEPTSALPVLLSMVAVWRRRR